MGECWLYTYSVYVADGRRRKVVVNDQVHPLEVNPPAHQVRADQDPDLGGMGMRTDTGMEWELE